MERAIEGRTVNDTISLTVSTTTAQSGLFPPLQANDVVIGTKTYKNDEPLRIIDWKGVQTAELGIVLVFLEERMRGGQRLMFSNVSVSQSWNNWVFDGGQGDNFISFEEMLYAKGYFPSNLIAQFSLGSVSRTCSRSPVSLPPTGGPGDAGTPITWSGVSILKDADDKANLRFRHTDPDGPCRWADNS